MSSFASQRISFAASRSLALLLLATCLCCGEKAPVEEEPLPPPSWTVVHEDLDSALLSVWSDEDNVIAVGADAGAGPLVLRLHDGEWDQLETGARGALWWVNSAPDGRVWMVGEDGLTLRYDLVSGEFERIESDTNATLFGVFFDANGDGCVVGARIQPSNVDEPRGVLREIIDGEWVSSSAIATTLADHALFKVWGDDGDLWAVGERGLVLRRIDGSWSELDSGVTQRLFTVHGAPGQPVRTVGGANNALLLGWDGSDVTDDSAALGDFAPALNGVHVSATGVIRVVGSNGFYASIDGGDVEIPEEQMTYQHLHAVREDSKGGVWMVGGALLSPALDAGVMLYYGSRPPVPGP